jgi:cytochrome c oxidase assembly protein subunit 15
VILAFLAQCVLGGLTVLKLLNPGVVSMHLLNALIFYGLLLQALFKMQMFLDKKNHVYALDVLLVKSPLAKNPLYLKHSMYGLGLCVLVQIVWGSMVSSQHAGVACPDFPLCHGHVFLPLSFPWLVWLHYLHRWFGYGIVWIVLFFRYFSVTHRRGPDFLVQLLNVILILLCLQIILGIFNVFYAVPAFLSVLHLANAILIFTLVIWGAFRLDSSMHKRILHLVSKAN